VGEKETLLLWQCRKLAREKELLWEQRKHHCCGRGEIGLRNRAPVGAEETSLLWQSRKLDRETELLREQSRHHCCGSVEN